MKLRFSPASPYVRKVMVTAIETGLAGRIEKVATNVVPVTVNAEVARENPLMKVPTLVADDGTALFDSPVICEYLDSLHSGQKLFPASGAARWKALKQQALADGILDAAILCRYEDVVRPAEKQWADWRKGQMTKITQSLDALEAEADGLSGPPTIGTITAACALGYLDFRFGDIGWRNGRAKLAKWFEEFSKRKSMQETVPHA